MNKEVKDQAKPSFRSGLTWRAIMGLIAIALLFIPTNIFMNLSTGMMISTAAIYILAILFSELTRYGARPLSKQEMYIVYSTVGTIAGAVPAYYWLVYRAFFVASPVTYAYRVNGIPVPYLVPDWIAPLGVKTYTLRTLLHPAWIKPIMVFTIFLIFGLLGDLGLTIFLSYIAVEVDKLPFPFATVDASLIETITTRETSRTRAFIAGFYPGLIYGALLYGGYGLGVPILPLPWADFTWFTEKYIPGALIGISTDPMSFVLGLIIPASSAFAMLLGSAMVWILLNYVFTINPHIFPLWASEYYRGMSLNTIYQRSFQRIWISPQFGLALGLALALVTTIGKRVWRVLKSITKAGIKGRVEYFPSLSMGIGFFLIGSIGSSLMLYLLIPQLPLYLILMASLGVSFAIALVAVYSIGEIGFFPQMPWPWQAIVYMTPYQGVAAWIMSPYICYGTPGFWSQSVKVAYLTETTPKDYFKAITIAVVLNAVVGLLVMDAFWRLAPIPSSAYPASIIYWPLYATNDCLFITRQIRLDPVLIAGSAALAYGMVVLSNIIKSFPAIPLIMGCYMLPPQAITVFIGSFIGNYVLARYLKKEMWESIKGVFGAGLLSGVGVFVGIYVALTLISKAAWVWPW